MTPAPTVVLRASQATDRDRLLAWRNQPEIAAWMYTDHEITAAEHARWFAAALEDPRRRYWIIEADGEAVGLANLYDIDGQARRCAWAYYIAGAAARGKGVGACAEFLVIERVFGELGLNKLWCEVLVENTGVLNMHRSFGFEREALLRQHVWKGAEPRDVIGLGLLAADWAGRRAESLARLRRRGFVLD